MKILRKSSVQLQQRKNESEKNLRNYAFLRLEDLYVTLSSSPSGLNAEQVEKRQEEYGKNVITSGQNNTMRHRLRESVINPFNIVLFIIALITLFTDVIYSSRPDYLTVSIILSLIALSSLVAFVQGERSNAAAEKLSKMISNKADVLRDGEQIEILIDEIVPGDIVRLSSGDMIPADIRFLSAKDAFVAQAALTGESNPIEKFADIRSALDDALTDIKNIGFMGSNMVSGSATGIVLATSNETYIGSMAESLSGDRAKNSFERGVDSVSRLLIRLMIIMVPVVLLINGFTKGDWSSAILFAITIAVGLTPEMLPVIMTSTLAKGAVSMSKHQVIVKTLGAIQTFGEMDILCTDKTGTLTEDRIVLERYMNASGEDDARILRHAYLNSHFQTGLKNLIDLAIINRAVENNLRSVLAAYTRIDEIPFDFSRRRMSVVLEDKSGKRQLVTKGAVDEMLDICSFVEWNDQIVELTEDMCKRVRITYEKHNADGLRMIAVAQKNEVPGIEVFSVDDECDMVLIGFVGFLDPPKESAQAAILALREHGVRTVVLTGDSEGVAVKVCGKVGVESEHFLSGKDVESMDDAALLAAVNTCNLFAKLSPSQKERVVKAFQANGHTVGYMGDGINDAPPLRQADVGISVDSAVDIAKETADIILLKKDLMVLEEGVIEGRKTFGNIVKYIKMAASGNFGNMISVIIASVFLPFLPMLPIQILTQNLLCDFSQMGIPFDNIDREYLLKPRKWETKSIQSFMAFMGPLSSVFDVLCFLVMWWMIGANGVKYAPLFQCGWFVFGTVSQVLVIHMIRTAKVPFIQSWPTGLLMASTTIIAIAALIVAFSDMAVGFDMVRLPLEFAPWLIILLVGYCLSTQLLKVVYIRRFGEWL
ncbi:magnesium-translocating P-type ATPase [Kineothrix sp. MB12-C1]|uniref:magnesium-translocating P-type ATPase n=1 Tax=Kineothrix sp. MB12-C1 TaxID=3070215 RepID=UPI0027D34619|nr:magnesium-translocating P-type ATPase [Kineothrix sp. MB12-C1]WMC92860.1 magnesium-translocating P-type ATPase [Kineothrix sp. MB12-C1]